MRRNIFRELGKVLVDIGKLAIGSIVFASIMRGRFDTIWLILLGSVFGLLTVIIGVGLIIKGNEREEY
jgi:uncharacterized membrane protein